MYSNVINEEINEDKKNGMFPSLSTLIGGGTDLGDVGSPVGNGPIYIGVETPFKPSDRLPIATTGRVTDIHREKPRTKMEGPSDQGMDSMSLLWFHLS